VKFLAYEDIHHHRSRTEIEFELLITFVQNLEKIAAAHLAGMLLIYGQVKTARSNEAAKGSGSSK
jgi:hypothetical protein